MEKIAIINNGELPLPSVKGGATETLIQLLIDENEKRRKYEIHVFCVKDEEAQMKARDYSFTKFHYVKNEKSGCSYWLLRIINFISRRIGGYFWGTPYLHHILSELKKEDIHTIVLEGCSSFAHFLKRNHPGKYIARFHNLPSTSKHLWNTQCAQSISLNIGISNFVSNCIIDSYPYLKQNVQTLYNALDQNDFIKSINRDDFRLFLGYSPNDFVFIFSGRLQPYKGVLELIKAFTLITKKYSNARLMIVGAHTFSTTTKGQYEKECMTAIESLGNRVKFTGYIHHKDLYKYYKSSDCGVFPSIWEEPFGLTCLESLCCGLPTIITRSGGMPEIVDENCSIVVEKNGNIVNNLAYAMEKYLLDSSLCNQTSVYALKRSSLFYKEKHYSKYMDLIQAV